MELTQAQYDLIQEPIERYKFFLNQGVKVWNDTDINKAVQVLNELGLPDPTTGCDICKEQQYARAVFAQLTILFDKHVPN